jgi:hypothetical protein
MSKCGASQARTGFHRDLTLHEAMYGSADGKKFMPACPADL